MNSVMYATPMPVLSTYGLVHLYETEITEVRNGAYSLTLLSYLQ